MAFLKRTKAVPHRQHFAGNTRSSQEFPAIFNINNNQEIVYNMVGKDKAFKEHITNVLSVQP